jgi:glycosyltransferase involved in cell wall biosynthesis
MKILMTADTLGGVWTYALELAGQLHRQNVQVTLATMGDLPRPQQRREAHAIKSLTLYESTYKLEWMEEPWSDVQEAGDWLIELEEAVQPDVVHLNGYAHAALPWRAPTLVVAHSCVLSWWQAVKREPLPESWDTYAAAVRKGLAAANAVVAPTRAMLDSIIGNYGHLDRTFVIPNGRHIAPTAADGKWPFIISAGRLWDEAKNVRLLKQAADKLSWPVWLAGETGPTQGPPDRNPNINLLGRLSFAELARWLNRASIYCLPARYEPFGLGALEAALYGCALVLGDIESLREVWQDAAIYVSPDDPDQLASVLQDLIDHPDRRDRLAGLARERAAKYSPAHMAEEYVSIYRQLTASHAGVQEAACAS